MRLLAIGLLAATVLMAGCTQTADCSQTVPCNGQSPSPTTTTSSASGSSGGAQGGMLVRPPSDENQTATLDLMGAADRSGAVTGGQIRLTYTATNQGPDARTEGFCGAPYSFVLRDAEGKDHPMTLPQVRCMAYSENPFPHGATYAFNTTWNGTYAEGGHLVPAPPGRYTITATFVALRDGGQDSITLTLPVNILSSIGQQ